jgi:hypothetical protein
VSGLGQPDRAGCALDEREPDLALERGHVLAYGGLCEVERVCGPGERSARVELDQHLQPPHVQH